ncbi:MAG: hypothetical protein K940chlam9_01708 [Chlamydiae bacterium]|nr:hypothetical protein [Chlamydiota bacterium]
MKITSERFEISTTRSIAWEDVETLRVLNDKLALVLSNGEVVELSHLRPTLIDSAFRSYERYLKDHPEKKRKSSP